MKENLNTSSQGRKPYVSPTMEVCSLFEEAHTICGSDGEQGGHYENNPTNPIDDPSQIDGKEFNWFDEDDGVFEW